MTNEAAGSFMQLFSFDDGTASMDLDADAASLVPVPWTPVNKLLRVIRFPCTHTSGAGRARIRLPHEMVVP
jgi:hypothetical protein